MQQISLLGSVLLQEEVCSFYSLEFGYIKLSINSILLSVQKLLASLKLIMGKETITKFSHATLWRHVGHGKFSGGKASLFGPL